MKSALLSDLARGSLVELLPGLEDALIEHGLVHHFAAGAEVAREGDRIEQLLIPIDAGLRLFDGTTGVEVGYLGAKRSLGLREAVDDRAYRYSARTEQATTIALLPAEEFRKLLSREPKLERYLRLATRSSGIRAFRRYLGEHGISWPDALDLLSQIEPSPLSFSRGEPIPTSTPALYFVSGGEVAVWGYGDQKLTLSEGAWFGGESLVPPHRTAYRAEAHTAVKLHRAPMLAVRTLIERLDLVDRLYDEPALSGLSGRSDPQDDRADPLPLLPLSADALPDGIDPGRIARCTGARAAFACTLRNAALVLGVTANPARIEAGLALRRTRSLLALAEELEAFGVVTAPTTTRASEVSALRYPAIALTVDRPVLLLEARERGVVVLDAVQGPGFMDATQLEGLHLGQVLELRVAEPARDTAADANRPTKPAIRSVLSLLFRDRSLLYSFAGLTALSLGLGLLSPLFLRYLLDEVLLLGTMDLLVGLMIGLALTTVVSSLVTMGRGYVLAELSLRLDGDLSRYIYRHALSLPMRFYDRVKVGDVLSRLHEVERIRDFFSTKSVESVIDLLSVFVYAGVLFAFSPMIGLAASAMVIALVILQLAMRKPLRRLYERAFEAGRRNRSLVAEMFGAMTAVKASGAEPVLRSRFEETVLDGLETRRRLGLRIAYTQAGMNLLSTAGTTGVLWFVCLAALEGRMSVGSILAASMYLQAILAPVRRLSGLLSDAEEVQVATAKLDEVLLVQSEEDAERAQLTHAVRLRGKLRLENIAFRYGPQSPLVLRDIDLTIYPGQTVAVVGRSGSGKSTLVNLMAGMLRPSSGRLYYDDHDSAMVAIGSLRKQVGFLRQDFQLFAGSISENIAYSDDTPDDGRIRRAARLAYADEFVSSLPLGFEHFLPAGGTGLSGGQKQRLALARVIYSDPKILILDEAFSSLDAESEAAISANMADITAGRTTIVVAHRLSTVQRADRIVVVDEGRIVEEGDHDGLLRKGGQYSELFEGQIAQEDTPA